MRILTNFLRGWGDEIIISDLFSWRLKCLEYTPLYCLTVFSHIGSYTSEVSYLNIAKRSSVDAIPSRREDFKQGICVEHCKVEKTHSHLLCFICRCQVERSDSGVTLGILLNVLVPKSTYRQRRLPKLVCTPFSTLCFSSVSVR